MMMHGKSSHSEHVLQKMKSTNTLGFKDTIPIKNQPIPYHTILYKIGNTQIIPYCLFRDDVTETSSDGERDVI